MGDFDFLVGSWNVHNRRLTKRLVGSDEWEEFTAPAVNWSLFDGMANVDETTFPDGTKGLTLRLFDPASEEWSLHWASSESGRLFPPVVGRFANEHDSKSPRDFESCSHRRGVFYGDDTEGGTPVRVRFTWSDITPDSARWEQAFSVDGGASWEVNWTMRFSRV
jgi:hypothetical protein